MWGGWGRSVLFVRGSNSEDTVLELDRHRLWTDRLQVTRLKRREEDDYED